MWIISAVMGIDYCNNLSNESVCPWIESIVRRSRPFIYNLITFIEFKRTCISHIIPPKYPLCRNLRNMDYQYTNDRGYSRIAYPTHRMSHIDRTNRKDTDPYLCTHHQSSFPPKVRYRSGTDSNFPVSMCWIMASCLNNRPLSFISLTLTRFSS